MRACGREPSRCPMLEQITGYRRSSTRGLIYGRFLCLRFCKDCRDWKSQKRKKDLPILFI